MEKCTALINASGVCINALKSVTAGLLPGANERVVEITEAEFDAHPIGKILVNGRLENAPVAPVPAAAPAPLPTARDLILQRLAEIDYQTSKPRTKRELLPESPSRASTVAWVLALDAEAATLRAQLKLLP